MTNIITANPKNLCFQGSNYHPAPNIQNPKRPAHLIPHGSCLQQCLSSQCTESLVAVHKCDPLTKADQAQQPKGANPSRQGALRVYGPAVQVVHLRGRTAAVLLKYMTVPCDVQVQWAVWPAATAD